MLTRPSFWLAAALTIATWSAAFALLVAPAPVRTSANVIPSTTYDYAAPPSISRDTYISIWCDVGSMACEDAGVMYDVLVSAGLDPAIEAAQAGHETTWGTLGVGQPQYKNAHGVQCFNGDGRIGEASVPWGNGCAGVYASYTDSVQTWAALILREYVNEGLTTPALAVPKYAPTSDGNNPPAYIADMETKIDAWRAREQLIQPGAPQSNDVRAELVNYALSLQGMPYVRGGRSADGGDCSGTMQFIYKQVAGIDIGDSTFSQWPRLQPVEPSQLQAGDLWYGVFPDDEHTGMLADVDNDGRWDLIHNGADAGYLHVTYDFGSTYLVEHTKGYRRAL